MHYLGVTNVLTVPLNAKDRGRESVSVSEGCHLRKPGWAMSGFDDAGRDQMGADDL